MRQITLQNTDMEGLAQQVKVALLNLPKGKQVEVIIRDPARTGRQNRAMHKFFEWIATTLNDNNLYLSRSLLRPNYEAEWTQVMVKEILWRPTQKALTGKQSSKDLTTKELTTVAETIQQALAKRGLDVEFPSIESFIF